MLHVRASGLLAAIEDVTGRLTPRRIDTLERAGLYKLAAPLAELADLDVDLPVRPAGGRWLRPYIAPPQESSEELLAHYQPMDFLFPHGRLYLRREQQRPAGDALAELTKRLLYADCVLIDDPVTAAATELASAVGRPVGPLDGNKKNRYSRQLRQALDVLVVLRPLIVANLIVLLPTNRQGYEQFHYDKDRDRFVLWASGDPGPDPYDHWDRDADVRWDSRFRTSGVRDLLATLHTEHARHGLTTAFLQMEVSVWRHLQYPDQLDFDLPGPLSALAMAEYLAGELAHANGRPADRDLVRYSELAALPLIEMSDVSADDLVRLHEAAFFDSWRLRAGHALDVIAADAGKGGEVHADRAGQILAEHLIVALQDTRFVTRRGDGPLLLGSQQFIYGGIGATIGAITTSPEVALAAAAGVGGAHMAWTALLRHARARRDLETLEEALQRQARG